ncbi:CopY/TcrY family copper transport repressor [Streptococcaceae bacterium ESL0687]|nr:CopY/TcrY family copper transport repressor [Streptococcaceae bacterium ESL0687]
MINTISDAEWDVMRVIWTNGSATVDDVASKIDPSHGWQLSTIKTLLGRLVKKEMLSTQKEGRRYIYSARLSEGEAAREMADELADKICTKQRVQAIAELIKISDFTEADLEILRDALDHKTSEVMVKCNCIFD